MLRGRACHSPTAAGARFVTYASPPGGGSCSDEVRLVLEPHLARLGAERDDPARGTMLGRGPCCATFVRALDRRRGWRPWPHSTPSSPSPCLRGARAASCSACLMRILEAPQPSAERVYTTEVARRFVDEHLQIPRRAQGGRPPNWWRKLMRADTSKHGRPWHEEGGSQRTALKFGLASRNFTPRAAACPPTRRARPPMASAGSRGARLPDLAGGASGPTLFSAPARPSFMESLTDADGASRGGPSASSWGTGHHRAAAGSDACWQDRRTLELVSTAAYTWHGGGARYEREFAPCGVPFKAAREDLRGRTSSCCSSYANRRAASTGGPAGCLRKKS